MIIYFGSVGLNGNIDLKHKPSVQRGTNLYRVTECRRIAWGKNMAKEQGTEVRDSKIEAEFLRFHLKLYWKSRFSLHHPIRTGLLM